MAPEVRLNGVENEPLGIVNINETPNYWETPIPYGGVAGRKSGLGRLGGPNTIREVMDQRAILMDIEKGGF